MGTEHSSGEALLGSLSRRPKANESFRTTTTRLFGCPCRFVRLAEGGAVPAGRRRRRKGRFPRAAALVRPRLRETESETRGGVVAMAGCAGESCSLLVQISPVACSAERLEHKLQIYFQSQKRSGGGECDLVAEGPNPGIYRVQFRSEEGNWAGQWGRGQRLGCSVRGDPQAAAFAREAPPCGGFRDEPAHKPSR